MKADHIVEALTGDSGWKDMIPQVNSSDFPTQWVPSAYECSIIDAQAKEIEKLRGQNEQLREAAALVTKESAELLERRWIPVEERLPEDRSDVLVVAYWHERWGAYMGWCAPERAAWSVHVGIGDRSDIAVTHWMPLPEPPEEER